MAKPIEVTVKEIENKVMGIQNLGDFSELLYPWIVNRAESQPQTPDILAITKFVVDSYNDIKTLLGYIKAPVVDKPLQTHLIESQDLKTLEHQINQFLTMQPSASPDVQIQAKFGGGYFAVITGRFNTEFSSWLEETLKGIQ